MKAEHECVLRYQIAGCLFKWEQTLRHNTWRGVSTSQRKQPWQNSDAYIFHCTFLHSAFYTRTRTAQPMGQWVASSNFSDELHCMSQYNLYVYLLTFCLLAGNVSLEFKVLNALRPEYTYIVLATKWKGCRMLGLGYDIVRYWPLTLSNH